MPVAFQCFSSCWPGRAIKAFSVFHSAPSGGSLWLRKMLGVNRDGIVDQNSLNGYFLPNNVVPSNKICAFNPLGLAWSTGGIRCATDFATLVHLFPSFLNCLYYNLSFSRFCSSKCLPRCHWKRRGEWVNSWCILSYRSGTTQCKFQALPVTDCLCNHHMHSQLPSPIPRMTSELFSIQYHRS